MLAKGFNKGQKTRHRGKTPLHQGQFKDTFSNFKRLRFAMPRVSSPSKMMMGSCFTTESRWLISGRSIIQIFRTVPCHWSQQILDSIHEQSPIIRSTVSKMGIDLLTCIIKSIWNTIMTYLGPLPPPCASWLDQRDHPSVLQGYTIHLDCNNYPSVNFLSIPEKVIAGVLLTKTNDKRSLITTETHRTVTSLLVEPLWIVFAHQFKIKWVKIKMATVEQPLCWIIHRLWEIWWNW